MSRSGEVRRYSAKAPFVGSPGLEPWRAAHTRIAEYEIRLCALGNVHKDTCKLNENDVGVLVSLGMSAKARDLDQHSPWPERRQVNSVGDQGFALLVFYYRLL